MIKIIGNRFAILRNARFYESLYVSFVCLVFIIGLVEEYFSVFIELPQSLSNCINTVKN